VAYLGENWVMSPPIWHDAFFASSAYTMLTLVSWFSVKFVYIVTFKCLILRQKCTNSILAWASPQTRLGELTAFSQIPCLNLRGPTCNRYWEGIGEGMVGEDCDWMGGNVDCPLSVILNTPPVFTLKCRVRQGVGASLGEKDGQQWNS